MNEQKIDALGGRDLDVAIEKYVFGNVEPPKDGTDWEDYQDKEGVWYGTMPGYGRGYQVVEWPPEYHNSDYLAFQVVDKIECQEISFMLYQMTSKFGNRSFESDFFNPRTTVTIGASIAKSRSLSICRAALKVVCREQ